MDEHRRFMHQIKRLARKLQLRRIAALEIQARASLFGLQYAAFLEVNPVKISGNES